MRNILSYFQAILGVPIFDPKWTRFTPKSPKHFQFFINISYVIDIKL
jgi:hypothetical protein